MSLFKEIKAILRESSGKKLAALSVGVFLLITAIVFFATFKLCESIHLKQMYDYLGQIPMIIESGKNELEMRSRVYEDDSLTRAELGLKIYTEDNELGEAEKLERVRDAVSADSVSMVDRQRKLLSTTGSVSPEEIFTACIQTLEPGALHLELYPASSDEGTEDVENDGEGFVMLPIPESAGQSLVFEFSCHDMVQMYNALNDWDDVLRRALSSEDATAYAITGDKLAAYPMENPTPEQIALLKTELTKIFDSGDKFRVTADGKRVKLISLQAKRCLAALMHYPQEEADVLLTIPLQKVIGNGIYIALAISAIIGWGIILIQFYLYRRLIREKPEKDNEKVSLGWVCRTTWPGILVVVAVTAIFSSMLLMLENRTNATFFAMSSRESIQYEIDWRKEQEKTILNTFTDCYLKQAQTLAAFLKDNPGYQTHAGLEELNRIAGADYLMRFDKTGQEIVSSNSYTGFSIGENLSEEYQAVVKGYPYAVAGPTVDAYTGSTQLGAAVLMTDSEGLPDGFLLAVYSADGLNAELKRMKLESTVNNFAVQQGHIAAAINDEGYFIAHTDPQMIGQKAENYLQAVEPGSSYEGFTKYDRKSVYVSASVVDGKTLMFIVPEDGQIFAQTVSTLMILSVLLILALLYYPSACVLNARLMQVVKRDDGASGKGGNPMMTFFNGYVILLTLFVIFTLIASSSGWWTSFDYVLSRQWSKGVHLFSLWAALFVLVTTLFCEYVIRSVLSLLESRLSLRAKTITRLASSLTIYVVIIFLAFSILDMFGVNTTALLASAGIISIAVGMGAQSMAADLLAGFFMMLEGSVRVGDLVSVGGITGHVTDMGIRTTEITDGEGNVVILNNSKVTGLVNRSRKDTLPEAESDPKNDTKNDTKNEQ